ncbi:chemotaxis protein CheA [Rhodanobacter sp. MP1X3]|uniref:chemotaxis protein CheA n=1 Tax=Rhodanobacter sp. MP1X3 TaxID=2723086 RepID=UPI00161D36B6|nr:chemotaxis protein CheA [Rhodanobacter sp. MP1X3]MBB6240904.1 two-component system chemotaxis sensor kinase CheA [Rhodanobacter sp. MP1X3]
MDPSLDSELRDDFLVEAGELVLRLGEQLIQLETSPLDRELLNAVFRVFHTVKGGAGFLAIEPMVQLCHCAEELLNEARNATLVLGPAQMDALLEALDLLNGMMDALIAATPLTPPPSSLLGRLRPAAAKPEAATTNVVVNSADADAVEQAFEVMLDEMRERQPAVANASGGHINDNEFEALLDSLYGTGVAPGVDADAAPMPSGAESGVLSRRDDPIDVDEFEALLDSLHGKGLAPGTPVTDATSTTLAPLAPVIVDAAAIQPTTAQPTAASATSAATAAKPVAASETTVRVDTAKLDALVNRAGELVLLRNRLLSLASRSDSEPLTLAAGELDRISDELQTAVLGMRMQPVGRLFQRFPRIVRDLARQLGKDIELIQEGEDTDLDRSLVEALADPLVHLLRNAVDHGLETPVEREQAGKSRKGTVRLAASQRGERIVISVSDDGRGMDPEVLRRKALEKGVIDAAQAARLSEVECYELIFRPGFSTAATISDISGRGVGMDVVKTRVAELGGTLQVRSRLGHGSTLELTVPLTLAILRVLMVRVGDRLFALPLGNVSEVFELGPVQNQALDGRRVAAHRGRALMLGDLAGWAGIDGAAGGHVVVLHVGHLHLGCLVHEVIGREDVMVKPLGPLFEGVPGVAGATVTGDGRLALVLDLAALAGDGDRLLPSLKVSA